MEEMLTQLFNHLIVWADAHGIWAVGLLAVGILLSPKAVPVLKKIACRTPTKLDDMAVNALELLITQKSAAIEQLTASELEKIISTPVLAELVKLRKARIAAERTASSAAKP